MPSSVTVDDELRKKLKKLAAELDTTQGEIISKAVRLYEREIGIKLYSPDPKARELIKKVIKGQQDIKWRKMIRKALQAPGPKISEMRITNWGEIDADKP